MFTEVAKSDVEVIRAFLEVVGDLLDRVEAIGEADLTVEYVETDDDFEDDEDDDDEA